ncbi:MAG TPA: 16S rRNA processing protein RimM [Bryocella sp.]|nr:16S rRNA processing protein RimM [Bryocella sp.]
MTENVSPTASPASAASWTPAARLLRPQGRRGELLAEPLSDVPGLFEPGCRVRVAAGGTASAIDTTLESQWAPTGRNAGRIVLKLTGVDSISAAELLSGRELLVPSSDLPPLDPDTWFVRDLLGCRLFDGSTLIGEITGVEYPMAADGRTRLSDAAPLLEVTASNDPRGNPNASSPDTFGHAEPALIPFIKAWLDSVDLEQRRVIMHLPPGLVDTGE